MLVLTRNVDDCYILERDGRAGLNELVLKTAAGERIQITLVPVPDARGRCRVLIDAPKSVTILRGELARKSAE